jgi:polyribonucleotide nucleotidyltransferase
MSAAQTYKREFGGKELIITINTLATQANGAALARMGDTVVLATVVMGEAMEGKDFFPLVVDYEEKFYAAGKIKGSRFVKREGRPTDEAVTTGRLVDRAIRPLFPQEMRNEVQVVVTVLSYDERYEPDTLAINATSAALAVSDVPWNGPVGALHVGLTKGGKLQLHPEVAQREENKADVVVAGTTRDTVMLEIGAREAREDDLLHAIAAGKKVAAEIAQFIGEIQAQAGKRKAEVSKAERSEEIWEALAEKIKPRLAKTLAGRRTKEEIAAAVEQVTAEVEAEIAAEGKEEWVGQVGKVVAEIHRELVREWIMREGKRVDGRALDEIRALEIKVGLLPRTHGSGLFERGETRVLSVCTLGSPEEALILDQMELTGKKHFLHYYNFPPYCTGEVKPMRGPGRREIGHGALAERALQPVMPSPEQFPYTTLVVSEVMSSNGSSSMASACAASLALMDAGVPIARPVAGIAIGLVMQNEDNYRLITDIAGMEDEGGDMDLKVAGTRLGVTAVQMDIKVTGVSVALLKQAFAHARAARMQILEAMAKVLPAPRPHLSQYAPRVEIMKIPQDRIGDVIGPRGKTINDIIQETGAEITIEEDGQVYLSSHDVAALRRARKRIEDLTREIKIGERFRGKVVKVTDYGAFVQILPHVDGLLHVSQLSDKRVRRVSDVLKVGDMLPVIVVDVEPSGRVILSHKAAVRRPEDTIVARRGVARDSRTVPRPPRPRRPSRR